LPITTWLLHPENLLSPSASEVGVVDFIADRSLQHVCNRRSTLLPCAQETVLWLSEKWMRESDIDETASMRGRLVR